MNNNSSQIKQKCFWVWVFILRTKQKDVKVWLDNSGYEPADMYGDQQLNSLHNIWFNWLLSKRINWGFSHDVTEIQTTELLILLRFYFHYMYV